MKRVGLIDNLNDIDRFLAERYFRASAEEVMTATGGNTGNVAFVFGARRILKNPITRVGWGWNAEVVRSRFDHLVVCCANQIGSHADLGSWAARLEQFSLPVTLIGLGAQADDMSSHPRIPDGTLAFLEQVKAARPGTITNVAVRGSYTQDVLHAVGTDSSPLGCPSLHIDPMPGLGGRILRRQGHGSSERIAVAAGNPWHAPSATLERLLVEIVDNYRGDYILQHPVSMLEIAYEERDRLAPATISRFLEVYGERFRDIESLVAWFRSNASVFVDAANWMRHLAKFDLALGPRYHGVALAVQAGVPGCVVTIDARTEELCQGTGIKYFNTTRAKSLTSQDLVEAARWTQEDADRLDETRVNQAHGYVKFLQENGLEPADELRQLGG